MEIKVQDFVDRIEASDYTRFEVKKTASAVKKSSLKKQMEPIIAAVSEAVATGHLAQAQLEITGKITVTYRIETGVLNLPFENSKKIFQFFDMTQATPVKIYLVTVAENLNVSGFRIDEMGTADDLMTAEASVIDNIMTQVQTQWQFLEEHPEGVKPAPVVKKEPATKAKAKTTTKTKAKTTKKTTTKRKTTKAAAQK